MAIAASGAIDMDEFHVEAGGTSGDECSLNDSDIRGLISKDAGAAMAMNEWYGASAEFYDFDITNSLRFNDAFLNFTPSSAGNRKTWTWSSWVKRSKLGATQSIIDTRAAVNATQLINIYITSGDQLNVNTGSADYRRTNQVFRDTSAWFHLVVAFDTTNSTADNRVRIYINGGEVTSFAVLNNPSLNVDNGLNQAAQHCIGTLGNGSGNRYDGYLADVCLIDGLQLTPSSFGETKNDIWIPKDTSGLTFGGQGWRLQFKQTGTGTASSTTIGADTSGNDNHWTSNSLVASDVTIDSPTNNFPVQMHTDANGAGSVTEGGLKSQVTSSGNYYSVGTNIGMKGGKYYFEYRPIRGGNNSDGLPDIRLFPDGTSSHTSADNPAGSISLALGTRDGSDGVYMVALDLDNGKVYRGRNGSWSNSGDPTSGATGTGAVTTLTAANLTSQLRVGVVHRFDTGTSIVTFNFGQEGTFLAYTTAGGNADANGFGNFKYAPPSGYLAICTRNLPDPVATIDPKEGGSPQDYFNTVLYTGTGQALDVNTVGFQPDWVWLKQRNAVDNHVIFDSIRGVGNELYPNLTNAESGNASSLTAFDAAGFNLGNNGDLGRYNENNSTYAAWNWKAGTAFSNDASSTSVGSIDSTGSVNTDVGFSIISYTGNSSGNATVAHGLSKAPEMIIQKSRNEARHWLIWHTVYNDADKAMLFTTDGPADARFGPNAPTTSVFGLYSGQGNRDGTTAIAYCFHSVDGYSKFGSYTGNGNADGPFVYTGFRPAWVMVKRTNDTGHWPITNSKTLGYNPDNNELYADLTQVEATSDSMDYLSNGFKLRWTSTEGNANGSTYIYMAFAKQPFKYANAR